MAISIIVSTSAGAPTGATVATTGFINSTGGSLIVVFVADLRGTVVPNQVQDNKGNSYAHLVDYDDGVASGSRIRVYYNSNPIVANGHQFTYNSGGVNAAHPSMHILVISGTVPNDTPTLYQGLGLPNGTAGRPGSFTPPNDRSIVICGVSSWKSTSANTIDSGFTVSTTQTFTANHFSSGLAYLIQDIASAVNPTWTYNVSSSSSIAILSFRPIPTFSQNANFIPFL